MELAIYNIVPLNTHMYADFICVHSCSINVMFYSLAIR